MSAMEEKKQFKRTNRCTENWKKKKNYKQNQTKCSRNKDRVPRNEMKRNQKLNVNILDCLLYWKWWTYTVNMVLFDLFLSLNYNRVCSTIRICWTRWTTYNVHSLLLTSLLSSFFLSFVLSMFNFSWCAHIFFFFFIYVAVNFCSAVIGMDRAHIKCALVYYKFYRKKERCCMLWRRYILK